METSPLVTASSGYQNWYHSWLPAAGIQPTPAVLVDTSVDTSRLHTGMYLCISSKPIVHLPLVAGHHSETPAQKCKGEER